MAWCGVVWRGVVVREQAGCAGRRQRMQSHAIPNHTMAPSHAAPCTPMHICSTAAPEPGQPHHDTADDVWIPPRFASAFDTFFAAFGMRVSPSRQRMCHTCARECRLACLRSSVQAGRIRSPTSKERSHPRTCAHTVSRSRSRSRSARPAHSQTQLLARMHMHIHVHARSTCNASMHRRAHT